MVIHYQYPLDRTFHALGDGTRRGIISLLVKNGTLSATELSAPFDMSQPSISKHLKVLEQAGLIVREVDGRSHRFQLSDAPLADAQGWIESHRAFWEGTLKSLENFVVQVGSQDDDA